MDKIENFIGRLTEEETVDLARAALEILPEPEAMLVVKDWITSRGLEGEFGWDDEDEGA